MPFGYFGAKHGLARFYTPPKHSVIVEPFAGAAGYSCFWAKEDNVKRVVLVEKDPDVTDFWAFLLRMTHEKLDAYPTPVKGEKTSDPLIASAMGGEQMHAVLHGGLRSITSRGVGDWPRTIRKIHGFIDVAHKFEVYNGDYTMAESLAETATWFVDPPYTKKMGNSGRETAGGHRYGENAYVDHHSLGEWCVRRKGHVIVCEQEPADWLPFVPFRRQRNGVGAGTHAVRTEVVWENDI